MKLVSRLVNFVSIETMNVCYTIKSRSNNNLWLEDGTTD